MKSFTTGIRALYGIITFTLALAISAAPAWSQDEGGGDDDGDAPCTVSGSMTFDGTWLCFEHMDCDDGDVIGEDVCFKVN